MTKLTIPTTDPVTGYGVIHEPIALYRNQASRWFWSKAVQLVDVLPHRLAVAVGTALVWLPSLGRALS